MSKKRQQQRALFNSMVHYTIISHKVTKEQAKLRVQAAEVVGLIPEGYAHTPQHPAYDSIERFLAMQVSVEAISCIGGFLAENQQSKYTITVDLEPPFVGRKEGEICGRYGCQGVIQEMTEERHREIVGHGCHCSVVGKPPCSYCEFALETCPVCGWERNDEPLSKL